MRLGRSSSTMLALAGATVVCSTTALADDLEERRPSLQGSSETPPAWVLPVVVIRPNAPHPAALPMARATFDEATGLLIPTVFVTADAPPRSPRNSTTIDGTVASLDPATGLLVPATPMAAPTTPSTTRSENIAPWTAHIDPSTGLLIPGWSDADASPQRSRGNVRPPHPGVAPTHRQTSTGTAHAVLDPQTGLLIPVQQLSTNTSQAPR